MREVAGSNPVVPTIPLKPPQKVTQVEGTRTAEVENLQERHSRVVLWLLAPVVTIDVLLKILKIWHTLDTLRQFDVCMLFGSMVVVPLIALWGEKRGTARLGRFQIAVYAYILLFLATYAFSS